MLNKHIEKYSDWSLIFLRFGLGIVFLVHGLGKLFSIGPAAVGVSNFAGFLTSLGVPAALFFAWIVALVEAFGGLFLILGLFTRYASALLAVNMLIALLLVHLKNGFSIGNSGYEFVLLLLLGSIALLLSGSGKKLALDNTLELR